MVWPGRYLNSATVSCMRELRSGVGRLQRASPNIFFYHRTIQVSLLFERLLKI